MFAKGGQAEKLIIIATEEGRYNTLFQAARAFGIAYRQCAKISFVHRI